MAIRKYKPTSPARRFRSVSGFDDVTRSEPEKSLTGPVKKKGGRNNAGRITTRHQGGGHKRAYRLIDFRRPDRRPAPSGAAVRRSMLRAAPVLPGSQAPETRRGLRAWASTRYARPRPPPSRPHRG